MFAMEDSELGSPAHATGQLAVTGSGAPLYQYGKALTQNIQELMLRLRIDHYLETSAKVQTKEELRREAMPFFVQALSIRRPRLVTVDLESNDYKDEGGFTCCW